MLRILLADDHDVVRRGVRQLLEEQPEWHVCAEATTGREAVRLAKELRPNIAIIDLTMPELNGLEATRQIRAELPQTEVLIFTMHESEKLIRQVLAAGARGYLLKSDAARHVATAIESLALHRPFFTGMVSETILATFLQGGGKPGERETELGGLTPREREIIQLLAEGKSNKRISALLDISVKTVETHRTSIMRKLGVNSIVELVRFALRNELARP